MQVKKNEARELYTPLKCDVTNRLIGSKSHDSVIIMIADVDEDGIKTNKTYNYVLSGHLRASGQADNELYELALRDGIIKKDDE